MQQPTLEYILERPRNRTTEKFISTHWPEFYQLVCTYPGTKFTEKLYNYYHKCPEHVCETCGAPTTYLDLTRGYQRFCGRKCAGAAESSKTKARLTMVKRYGDHVSRVPEFQHKAAETNKERYGGTGFASKELVQKYKETCQERYGTDCASSSDEIKNRVARACEQKFGASTYARGKFLQEHPEIIGVEDGNFIVQCDGSCCDERQFCIEPRLYINRINDGTNPCTRLMPKQSRDHCSSIELFIRQLLDEHDVKHIDGSYDIIPPQQLDIYIPDKKVAIECNGVYWHSDREKPYNYHMDKFRLCRDHGIQLIQIWEDWIVNKPEIVCSMILSKLGVCEQRVYARKCEIREIDRRTCNEFLDANHIQGRCQSAVNLGLFYNGLVAVMAFNKRSKLSGGKNSTDSEWELIRFCGKLNTTIVGGAGKLLAHFEKHYNPGIVTSFSCNDISNGNLYKKLGFSTDGTISNSYWYVDRRFRRYHRSTFTKDSIIRKGLAPSTDKSQWTEREVMDGLGFFRIYDAGTTKWIKKARG